MSLYNMMCKSIYNKCTDALKKTPGWETALMATIPPLLGVMGGVIMDCSQSIDIMTQGGGAFAHVTPEGAAAYKAFLAENPNTLQDSWLGVVKEGLSGGYRTDGQNLVAVSVGALPTFPCLALIAKAAAHLDEMIRGKAGIEKGAPQVEQAYDAGPGR